MNILDKSSVSEKILFLDCCAVLKDKTGRLSFHDDDLTYVRPKRRKRNNRSPPPNDVYIIATRLGGIATETCDTDPGGRLTNAVYGILSSTTDLSHLTLQEFGSHVIRKFEEED